MSTNLQLRGDSLRRQLEASAAYAATHDLELVDESRLEDIGVSAFKGANVAEGALGRFLDAVKEGKVPAGSFLLVESLDRLSRQEVRKSLGLFLNIIDAGINIVTLTDSRVYTAQRTELVDLLTSLVIMSRAHEESATKSLRVGAAWASKRARARTQPLTAWCPAWLRLSSDRTKYETIGDRVAVVRRIFAESASGVGNYTITRRLNMGRVPHFGGKTWHQSYVSKILKNRAVIGEFQPHRLVNGRRVPDGDPVKGYFPAVIDEATFYRAQHGLSERLTRGAGRKGARFTNLFSGLLVCAYCGGPVKFESKGHPPKGASFLVCDGAKRGLGCEIARWRYDEFEASFLAFVRELDLERIVHGEDESKKRTTLESMATALKGERASVREQMEKTYDLLNVVATDFVAGKLKGLEDRLMTIEKELREGEAELASLGATRGQVRGGRDRIRTMVDRLQDQRGGDAVYRLRAAIASRLRSSVARVHVALSGDAPKVRRAIETLRGQRGWKGVIAQMQRQLDDERSRRRYFAVGFTDGTVRAVYPSDDDPLQFEEQLVSSDEEGLVRQSPGGPEQVFAPRG